MVNNKKFLHYLILIITEPRTTVNSNQNDILNFSKMVSQLKVIANAKISEKCQRGFEVQSKMQIRKVLFKFFSV